MKKKFYSQKINIENSKFKSPFEETDLSEFTQKIDMDCNFHKNITNFHFRKIDSSKLVEFDSKYVLPYFKSVLKDGKIIESLKNKKQEIEQIWEPANIDFE